ncbi:MAG: vanadium-dependent haloperoxidase [Pirellulales bacterium]|nr:vanadium-dependent haloperoxidase [Pirellulales bacterium]
MKRTVAFLLASYLAIFGSAARADVILDWNSTMRQSIVAVPSKANPGLATRALAMMNAAMYDIYQAYDHTYTPFLVNSLVPDQGANRDAAVARAARDILEYTYGEASATWLPAYNNRINALVDTPLNIANGAALGAVLAHKYIEKHVNDGFDAVVPYTPQLGVPGHWSSDPFWMSNPGPTQVQTPWGPEWGSVKPWAMNSASQFNGVLTDLGGTTLSSAAYANAYNQVLNYGALSTYGPANTPTSRTADQTALGKFWGYDVEGFGPPPVMLNQHLEAVATQAGNSPEENARLFAMASVAMGDAAIAAWKVKFDFDFWRPVTAIHAAGDGTPADADGNPATLADPNWQPLGAPGHAIISPDFTPPFPAYVSGHATMGGALFKSLELFYGTNDFDAIDGIAGNNPSYTLTSAEPDCGGPRSYSRFTELNLNDLANDLNSFDSPEGENAVSRVFLGIHWIFDGSDGIRLGNAVAQHVFGTRFQPTTVPEPTLTPILLTIFPLLIRKRVKKGSELNGINLACNS